MSATSSPCAESRSGRLAADAFTDAAVSASASGSAAAPHSSDFDSQRSSPCTPSSKRLHPVHHSHRGGVGALVLDERDCCLAVAAAQDDALPSLRPQQQQQQQRRELAQVKSTSPPRHERRSSPSPCAAAPMRLLPPAVQRDGVEGRHSPGEAPAPLLAHVTAARPHQGQLRQPHPVTATAKSAITAAQRPSVDADGGVHGAEAQLSSRPGSVAASRAVGSAGPRRVPTSIRVARHRADDGAGSTAGASVLSRTSPLGPASMSSRGTPVLHSPTPASSVGTATSTAGTEARHTEELVNFFTAAISGTIAMEAKRQAAAAAAAAADDDDAAAGAPPALPTIASAQRTVTSARTHAAGPRARSAHTRDGAPRSAARARQLTATPHATSDGEPATRMLFTSSDTLADVHDDVPACTSTASSPAPQTVPAPTPTAQQGDTRPVPSSPHILPLAEKSFTETAGTASGVASAETAASASAGTPAAAVAAVAAFARTSTAVALPQTRRGSPARDRPRSARTVRKASKVDPHPHATTTGATTATTTATTTASAASSPKPFPSPASSPKTFASTVSSPKPLASTASSPKPVAGAAASPPKPAAARKLAQTTRTANEVTSRLYQTPLTRPLAYFIRQASPPIVAGAATTTTVASTASPPRTATASPKRNGNADPAESTTDTAESFTMSPAAAGATSRVGDFAHDAARHFENLQRALAAFVFPKSPRLAAQPINCTVSASAAPAAATATTSATPAPTASRSAASPPRTAPQTRLAHAPTTRPVMPAITTSARGKGMAAKGALPVTAGAASTGVLAPPPASKKAVGNVSGPAVPRK